MILEKWRNKRGNKKMASILKLSSRSLFLSLKSKSNKLHQKIISESKIKADTAEPHRKRKDEAQHFIAICVGTSIFLPLVYHLYNAFNLSQIVDKIEKGESKVLTEKEFSKALSQSYQEHENELSKFLKSGFNIGTFYKLEKDNFEKFKNLKLDSNSNSNSNKEDLDSAVEPTPLTAETVSLEQELSIASTNLSREVFLTVTAQKLPPKILSPDLISKPPAVLEKSDKNNVLAGQSNDVQDQDQVQLKSQPEKPYLLSLIENTSLMRELYIWTGDHLVKTYQEFFLNQTFAPFIKKYVWPIHLHDNMIQHRLTPYKYWTMDFRRLYESSWAVWFCEKIYGGKKEQFLNTREFAEMSFNRWRFAYSIYEQIIPMTLILVFSMTLAPSILAWRLNKRSFKKIVTSENKSHDRQALDFVARKNLAQKRLKYPSIEGKNVNNSLINQSHLLNSKLNSINPSLEGQSQAQSPVTTAVQRTVSSTNPTENPKLNLAPTEKELRTEKLKIWAQEQKNFINYEKENVKNMAGLHLKKDSKTHKQSGRLDELANLDTGSEIEGSHQKRQKKISPFKRHLLKNMDVEPNMPTGNMPKSNFKGYFGRVNHWLHGEYDSGKGRGDGRL